MTRRALARRHRCRLQGERGFTIVETVVAITVIFGSLTALAYTATVGLRYIAHGRIRIQATGVANRIMEEIRGLPYDTVTEGLSLPEVAAESADADGHIEDCSGVYKFESCDPDAPVVVSSTFGAGYSADWLVSNQGVFTEASTAFEWSTYVTRLPDDPSNDRPYAVTVFVSWDTGGAAPGSSGNEVRLQSLFWSPEGCLGTDTHPYAAPCNPSFYGFADVTPATFTVTAPSPEPTPFPWHTVDLSQALLNWQDAEVSGQEEQIGELSGVATSPFVEVTGASGSITAAGEQNVSVTADNDPTTATPAVAGGTGFGTAADIARYQDPASDPGGQIGLQTILPSGSSLALGGSMAARPTDVNACFPWGVRQIDKAACLGASADQSGTIRFRIPFDHAIPVGEADLLRVAVPAVSSTPPTYATIDRIAGGEGQDGMLQAQTARRFGTIYLGGYPSSGMSSTNRPVGLVETLGDAANYCYRVKDYVDSATASVGEGPTALVAPSTGGSIEYLSGGLWQSIPVNSVPIGSLGGCSQTAFIGGEPFTWSVQANVLRVASAPAATVTTVAGDPTTRTKVEASTIGLRLRVNYNFEYDDFEEVTFTTTLDMGSLFARATYGPAPVAA